MKYGALRKFSPITIDSFNMTLNEETPPPAILRHQKTEKKANNPTLNRSFIVSVIVGELWVVGSCFRCNSSNAAVGKFTLL